MNLSNSVSHVADPIGLFQSLKKTVALSLTVGLTVGALSGCGKTTPNSRSTNNSPTDDTMTGKAVVQNGQIQVVSTGGSPIANARILIGTKLDTPFAGNLLISDKNGIVSAPAGWTSPQPVTIEASGFIRTTYFDRAPDAANRLTVKYRPSLDRTFELQGETTGYGEIPDDGFLDVALVLPGFSRSQIATFHPSDIFSKEIDSLSVLTHTAYLPANLSVPSQTKTYIFMPIHVEKPVFRLQLPGAGTYQVESLHARANIDEAVNHFRNGGSIMDLINKLQFTEGGLKKTVVGRGDNHMDMAIDQFKMTPMVSVNAPNFDAGLDMFSVVMPRSEGEYFVADVKKLKPQDQMQLSAPNGKGTQGIVVHFLKRRPTNNNDALVGPNAATLSLVISAPHRSQPIDFLEIVAPPSLKEHSLTLTPPKKTNGLVPTMTYLALSSVELVNNGKLTLERSTPEWELYGNQWMTSVALPQMPAGMHSKAPKTQNMDGKMRWEAAFAGQPADRSSSERNKQNQNQARALNAGPDDLEKATHVTRSAVDF
jgi:hypothetical protein